MADGAAGAAIMSGHLKKKASKGPSGFKQWKKRWVVLDAGGLTVTESEGGKEKGRISLDTTWLVRLTDPAAARFEVGDDKEIVSFQGATPAEARAWVDALIRLRSEHTGRWEDRMLAKVGASAGDRERLRAVCETWQDGHLTFLRERAEAAAAASAAGAGAAGAAGANGEAGAAGGGAHNAGRMWLVLDRATLWLSASPRTALTPLGYLALETVEAIRSLAGQRSIALLTERGDSVNLMADTRKLLIEWNVAIARVHSAARHLQRAEVLRRIEVAAAREPAGLARPLPISAQAAIAAHQAAKMGGGDGGGGLPPTSGTRLGAAHPGGSHVELHPLGNGSSGALDERGNAVLRSLSNDAFHGRAGADANGGHGAEQMAVAVEEDPLGLSPSASARSRPAGFAGILWLICRLPGFVLWYSCFCCPRTLRSASHRAARQAGESVSTVSSQALNSSKELVTVVDQKLLGGIGGSSVAAANALLGSFQEPSENTQSLVMVIERKSEMAELRIHSLRDHEGRHLKYKGLAILCGCRVPISNRWAKKVIGARVSPEHELDLWRYCRNLAKVGGAHARATGQPTGSTERVIRAPPRLAGLQGAPPPHAHVPLSHFLMMIHLLPLVPASGKFFNLDALAHEAAGVDMEHDLESNGGGGSSGQVDHNGASDNASGLEMDYSFVAPLLRCRDPAACKDAFFKAVPSLQKSVQLVHKAKDADLDDAEAARIAMQVANAWQAVLDAGGGPATGKDGGSAAGGAGGRNSTGGKFVQVGV